MCIYFIGITQSYCGEEELTPNRMLFLVLKMKVDQHGDRQDVYK